jgi:signal transduction histidine kinase
MDATNFSCSQLALLLHAQSDSLLREWRSRGKKLPSAKDLDKPTLNDHIPELLKELAAAFEHGSDTKIALQMATGTPPEHGLERLRNGFEVEEVVAEYNILRECIHEMATHYGIAMQGQPFHILNHAFDGAVGAAVRTYAVQQAVEVQQRRQDYLAFVAHDLRTPLNAISLAAVMLERMAGQHPDADRAAQAVKSLQRNAGYLSTLVDKILEENANLQTELSVKLQCRTIDLWPLVESLVYDLHPISGTGSTQLINNIPVDLTAYADAALLRRIFQNLIANALAHTPYGEVRITARPSETGDGVVCMVSDNGTGIAEDRLSLIFEKYEADGKTKRAYGLGLAICKTFVEAHGGTIGARSHVGQGSEFTFWLPGKQK